MGIEIRRVPADWEHPTQQNTSYGYTSKLAYQPKDSARNMFTPTFDEDWHSAFRQWFFGVIKWHVVKWLSLPFVLMGRKPTDPWEGLESENHRPGWWCGASRQRRGKSSEATHIQLYETVSEGTPLSPVFATSEEMAEWCAGKHVWNDTENMTVEDWRKFLDAGGYAFSGIFTPGHGYESGIQYVVRTADEDATPFTG